MQSLNYITVPEFSERAGVSPQAVYQRIKRGKLDDYVTVSNGVTMIAVEAAEKFRSCKIAVSESQETEEKQNHTTKTPPESPTTPPEAVETSLSEVGEEKPDEILKRFTETVAALERVIELQREEIREKSEMLSEKDKLIAEYADKFADLAHNALQTASQAQTLHAVSESGRVLNNPQTASCEVLESENSEDEQEKESKHWFWSLFKRK